MNRCILAAALCPLASACNEQTELVDENAADLLVYETAQTVGPIGSDPDV